MHGRNHCSRNTRCVFCVCLCACVSVMVPLRCLFSSLFFYFVSVSLFSLVRFVFAVNILFNNISEQCVHISVHILYVCCITINNNTTLNITSTHNQNHTPQISRANSLLWDTIESERKKNASIWIEMKEEKKRTKGGTLAVGKCLTKPCHTHMWLKHNTHTHMPYNRILTILAGSLSLSVSLSPLCRSLLLRYMGQAYIRSVSMSEYVCGAVHKVRINGTGVPLW
jgi:hypothetical protein